MSAQFFEEQRVIHQSITRDVETLGDGGSLGSRMHLPLIDGRIAVYYDDIDRVADLTQAGDVRLRLDDDAIELTIADIAPDEGSPRLPIRGFAYYDDTSPMILEQRQWRRGITRVSSRLQPGEPLGLTVATERGETSVPIPQHTGRLVLRLFGACADNLYLKHRNARSNVGSR